MPGSRPLGCSTTGAWAVAARFKSIETDPDGRQHHPDVADRGNPGAATRRGSAPWGAGLWARGVAECGGLDRERGGDISPWRTSRARPARALDRVRLDPGGALSGRGALRAPRAASAVPPSPGARDPALHPQPKVPRRKPLRGPVVNLDYGAPGRP